MSENLQARDLGQARPERPEVAEAPGVPIAEEQLVYSSVLDVGMKIGMLVLMATFAVYALGVLAPHIPVDDLPQYWSLSVKKYLAVTGIHPGWGWISMLRKGDFINFVGIALLSGVTIACYLAIIPVFFRKKDTTYGWLCILEVLVLALAASGILKGGGH
jgi:hypothetical protein